MNRIFKALAAALLLAAKAQAQELVHNPVLSAAAGQDLRVSTVLSGAAPGTRVRLFYRVKGKEVFKSVEMSGSPTEISAVIPGKSVSVEGLEYYIEATTGPNQVVASSPEANPKASPHFVSVRKDEAAPEVTALSPMDGGDVDVSNPVITAAFEDADSGIDPDTVMVKIDGVEADMGDAQVFDTMVSYTPEKPLKDGPHEAVVAVKDRAGNAGSVSVKFTVKATAGFEQKAGDKKAFRWNGSLGYTTLYGHVLTQPKNPKASLPYRPYGVNRARLEVTGRGEETVLGLKVSKTDEERSDQQPSDRYLATLKNDQGLIALGDYSPNFSELSLYNPGFLRGVTLDLRSGQLTEGHTRLIAVWGQTQRAIEFGSVGLAGGSSTATFAQTLMGGRWEFGGKYFLMGLNTVTVNDDPGSVKNPGSATPKFTWVNTSDVRVNITPIYLSLFAEGGASYYANGPTILGLNLGTSYRAGLDLNVLPSYTHITFDWKDLGGNLSFLPLPGGYTSMANPGLIPDYRGFESSFSQGLADNQVNASFNYNKWRDNLQSTRAATTETEFMSGNLNLAVNAWPFIVFGYNKTAQKNDATGNSSSGSYIQDIGTTSISVSLGYTHAFQETKSLSGTLSFINTTVADNAKFKTTQDLANNTVALSAFLNLGATGFSASGSFGSSNAPTLFGNATYAGVTQGARLGASNSYSARWTQAWAPRVFDSFLGFDLSTSNSDTAAAPAMIALGTSSNRSTYSLGGNYTPHKDHRLGFSLALAQVASSVKAATVTDDAVGQLYTNLNYAYTF